MKKLTHKLFLSCLKATELIEKRLHFKLSIKEKLQLKVHKMMCSACSNYEKQSIFIEKGISINQKREFSVDEIQQLKLIITEKISDTK
jgi:hypothetical protein